VRRKTQDVKNLPFQISCLICSIIITGGHSIKLNFLPQIYTDLHGFK